MGKRGGVGELKKKEHLVRSLSHPLSDFFFLSTRLSPDEMNERDLKNVLDRVLFPICRTPFPSYVKNEFSFFVFFFSLRPFLSLDQICAFASDPEKTSEALPPLNSFLRMKAHEHATALGIGHDSTGDGKARHIVLSKNLGETFEMEPLPASPAPPPRPAIKIILKVCSLPHPNPTPP